MESKTATPTPTVVDVNAAARFHLSLLECIGVDPAAADFRRLVLRLLFVVDTIVNGMCFAGVSWQIFSWFCENISRDWFPEP
jgi:hypothetical protein